MKRIARTGLILLVLGLFLPRTEAHVELDYPKGGESYQAGDTVHIQWHELIPHNTLNWDLLVSFDGGLSWDTLQADIPYDSLSFVWEVPNIASDSARIRVVQDNSGFDYFDESENFQIRAVTAVSASLREMEFQLGPVPTEGRLFLRLAPPLPPTLHLTLLDGRGQVVWRRRTPEPSLEIDLTSFPSGVYFLLLEWEGGRYVRKVLLQ